jgi:hypothetical protein
VEIIIKCLGSRSNSTQKLYLTEDLKKELAK